MNTRKPRVLRHLTDIELEELLERTLDARLAHVEGRLASLEAHRNTAPPMPPASSRQAPWWRRLFAFAGLAAAAFALLPIASSQTPVYNYFPPPGITYNAATGAFGLTNFGWLPNSGSIDTLTLGSAGDTNEALVQSVGTSALVIKTTGGVTSDLELIASNSASGTGAFIEVVSGSGTASNASGGAIDMLSGNAVGSGNAGNYSLSAGSNNTGTGTGGSLRLSAGSSRYGSAASLVLPGGPNSSGGGIAGDVQIKPSFGDASGGNVDIFDAQGDTSIQVTYLGLDYIVEPTASTNVGTFTISGCSATTPVGGGWAGTFLSGTSGTCTVTITLNVPEDAPNGWRCTVDDMTTPADRIVQSGSSASTCTVTGTTVSGDKLIFSAIAF